MIRILSWFFCKLPLPWALGLGRVIAWLWFYVIRIRRQVALNNLRQTLGAEIPVDEHSRIIRRVFEHLVWTGIESLRMTEMTAERASDLVRFEGEEHLAAAFARGKGLIGVISHVGNFEMLGVAVGLRGWPFTAVVKNIKNPAVQAFVSSYRRRLQFRTLPPKGCRDDIRAALKRNEGVGFVIDQHLPRHRAVVCSFFGRLAATSPAVARFGFETGSTILPTVIFRDPKRPGHHVIRVEPEFVLETPYADLQANIWHNTERMNRIVERWVREAPDQYLWLHRRWKVHENPEGWEIRPELTHLLSSPPKSDR